MPSDFLVQWAVWENGVPFFFFFYRGASMLISKGFIVCMFGVPDRRGYRQVVPKTNPPLSLYLSLSLFSGFCVVWFVF